MAVQSVRYLEAAQVLGRLRRTLHVFFRERRKSQHLSVRCRHARCCACQYLAGLRPDKLQQRFQVAVVRRTQGGDVEPTRFAHVDEINASPLAASVDITRRVHRDFTVILAEIARDAATIQIALDALEQFLS